ncbi:transposase [Microvirga sp. GCM10011540]
MAVTIPDPSSFRSGRHLAAWIGLVPRQSGTRGCLEIRVVPI